MARWQSCNIFQAAPDANRLWQFDAKSGALNREVSAASGQSLSMVELQLEKLSPVPVTQIVWTLQILPQAPAENIQTVIVVIVERRVVEEFLGRLETQGYLADQLQVPMLDQLAATPAGDD